jgi:hypothetical protein
MLIETGLDDDVTCQGMGGGIHPMKYNLLCVGFSSPNFGVGSSFPFLTGALARVRDCWSGEIKALSFRH